MEFRDLRKPSRDTPKVSLELYRLSIENRLGGLVEIQESFWEKRYFRRGDLAKHHCNAHCSQINIICEHYRWLKMELNV